MRRSVLLALALVATPLGATPAVAAPKDPPVLVGLAPADDARRAIAIGPSGQVYEPDGQGAWVRTQRISTADSLAVAARAGSAVVALGDGVVYRLADNGWSALRLAQKGKAVMAAGGRAIAAVGKQIYALDKLAGGEPAKLAAAASPVLAIGSGKKVVIQTERGLFVVDGARLTPVKAPPQRVTALIDDRWVLVDRGVADLRTGRAIALPAGMALAVAVAAPDDSLVAVATIAGKLELVRFRAGQPLAREPIELAPAGVPVGLTIDRANRVAIALRDGRLAYRWKPTDAWATAIVGEQLADPKPGTPPATSP